VLAAGVSDPVLRARLLLVGARLGAEQAAFDAALADLVEAEQVAREQGDDQLLAQALSERIALDARLSGQWHPELADEALAAFRRRGDRVGEGELLIRIGGVAAGHHRRAESVERFEQALELFRSAGNAWGEASALNNLGFIAAMEGRFEDAEDLVQRSLAGYERLRTPEGLGSALDSLAAVRLGQDRPADAVPLLERSLSIARELGYHPGIVIALTQLAWCGAHLGDLGTAAGQALEALELGRRLPDDLRLGAVETAAGVLVGSGRGEVAARLLAACARAREQQGISLTPLEARRVAADRAWLAGTHPMPAPPATESAPDPGVEGALELATRELRRAHPAW
jgi:tetratricopeptide (TPR) repeat protein